jgi:hypothetical protein
MSEWGNPLKRKQPKAEKAEKVKPEKTLAQFKKVKLNLTRAEAKKILSHHTGDLGYSQILWTQMWMEQRVRERSLPPHLAGGDAYSYILKFLSPNDASSLLNDIRNDFVKTQPPSSSAVKGDLDFLNGLGELEAYHAHLFQPHTSDHNNHLSDDDP